MKSGWAQQLVGSNCNWHSSNIDICLACRQSGKLVYMQNLLSISQQWERLRYCDVTGVLVLVEWCTC